MLAREDCAVIGCSGRETIKAQENLTSCEVIVKTLVLIPKLTVTHLLCLRFNKILFHRKKIN